MTFRIDRRGQARSVTTREKADAKRSLRRKLQREMHGLVLTVQGDRTVEQVARATVNVGSWWHDLRRGHLPVYGSLLRFIDVAIALGTPKAMVQLIPQWLSAYIDDQYEIAPRRAAQERLAA